MKFYGRHSMSEKYAYYLHRLLLYTVLLPLKFSIGSVTHITELLNFVDVRGLRTYYATNQLLGFPPPTKEVPHTCKIVYYF